MIPEVESSNYLVKFYFLVLQEKKDLKKKIISKKYSIQLLKESIKSRRPENYFQAFFVFFFSLFFKRSYSVLFIQFVSYFLIEPCLILHELIQPLTWCLNTNPTLNHCSLSLTLHSLRSKPHRECNDPHQVAKQPHRSQSEHFGWNSGIRCFNNTINYPSWYLYLQPQ